MKARERRRKPLPMRARASAWGKDRIVVAIRVDARCSGCSPTRKTRTVKANATKRNEKKDFSVVRGCSAPTRSGGALCVGSTQGCVQAYCMRDVAVGVFRCMARKTGGRPRWEALFGESW
jgi:hypothetical protein